MSHPDPKQNYEDEPDDVTFTRTMAGDTPGQTLLNPEYLSWLSRLETPIQEALGKLVYRLTYADDLSISHKVAVINRLSQVYDGTIDRLSRRLKAEEAAFLEEERIFEDERRDDPDGHDESYIHD